MICAEIHNLIKVYKTGRLEVIALRGLDCSVESGRLQAVVGPSGCGKTTLLNILGGLDKPTAGSVVIDGVDIATAPENILVKHRREQVGVVFQFFNLVPTLTAQENIELPMRFAGKDPDCIKKRARHLLSVVGLEQRADHRPDELSGGEQQRVALATAMSNDPPIILADEPTGELDARAGEQVLLLFRSLCDEFGKTVIIVTHDHRVDAVADNVMTMVDGRVTRNEPGQRVINE